MYQGTIRKILLDEVDAFGCSSKKSTPSEDLLNMCIPSTSISVLWPYLSPHFNFLGILRVFNFCFNGVIYQYKFKVILLTWKVMNNTGSTNIEDLLKVQVCRPGLRSNNGTILEIPLTIVTVCGNRALRKAGPFAVI